MLKKLVNECKMTLDITTTGPLLVKSGHPTPHGPDMTPVLTHRNGKEQVFIPGSSLKGAFRSHVEKIIRSVTPGVVCLPYDDKTSCGKQFEKRKKSKEDNGDLIKMEGKINTVAYRDSCPACRLFGSTFFSGRIAINDAYLLNESEVDQCTETRDGVAIDRVKGGASGGALFDQLVVRAGVTFQTDILLRNFEIWQLGAILAVIQDLEDELIRLGSGKSRGLGKVAGKVERVDIQYINTSVLMNPLPTILGLGKFLNGEREAYKVFEDDEIGLEVPLEFEKKGVRLVYSFTEDELATLKQKAQTKFIDRMSAWSAADSMNYEEA